MTDQEIIKKQNLEIQRLEHKLSVSIRWTVDHFKYMAIEINEQIYNPVKFREARDLMIKEHNRDKGITWDTVKRYLNDYCKWK